MGKLQFHTVDPRADVHEVLSEKLKKMHWEKETSRQIMETWRGKGRRRFVGEVESEGSGSYI